MSANNGGTPRFEVRAEGLRTVAVIASCDACSWEEHSNDGGRRERDRVRSASRRHAERTGHTVWIDVATMDKIWAVRRVG